MLGYRQSAFAGGALGTVSVKENMRYGQLEIQRTHEPIYTLLDSGIQLFDVVRIVHVG